MINIFKNGGGMKRFLESFTNRSKSSLGGFTLAEVLVTLGIIGVVAAMTLPSVVGYYKFKVWAVKFKKVYSLLQNTINLGVTEDAISKCYMYFPKGSTAYVAEGSDCPVLEEFLITTLKLKEIKIDKTKYASQATVKANGGSSINWACSYDYKLYVSKVYGLNDGTYLMLGLTSGIPYPVIIDVNGEKGPNKWGYDVFFMNLTNHNEFNKNQNKILLTDEYCSLIEKDGVYPRTILRNQEVNSDNSYLWK